MRTKELTVALLATADRQICTLECRINRGYTFKPVGGIGITEDAPLAVSCKHAGPHGGALSSILVMTEQSYGRRIASGLGNHPDRLIGTAVIDDDNLAVAAGSEKQLWEIQLEGSSLVVGRNDQAQSASRA